VTVQKDNTQVTASTSRRRFTAEYKLEILKEAEECNKPGMIGALRKHPVLTISRTNVAKGSMSGTRWMAQRKSPKMPQPTAVC
jgi:hypothetical protein